MNETVKHKYMYQYIYQLTNIILQAHEKYFKN